MDNNRPKIRTDLIFQEVQNKDGTKHYVIKDPITNAFFKIGEPEYFIISRFDGHLTIPEIAAEFKKKFNTDLEQKEIASFADEMERQCFLDNDLTRRELLKRQKEADANRPRRLLEKLLYIKLRAVDPSRLFDRMIGHVGFFFTRRFVISASFIMFLSLLITLYNAERIAGDILNMINIEGAILLYLSVFCVIILHEFAHGLTCRHYGGQVHELGFLLIYFQPAFYCNVSDAWLFSEKRKRLWVSFSGGFFQMFIWALAVIVWRVTQSDIFINKFSLAVMSFSGVASIFNFNPLMRFDGYYMLSDYVEIPNLRQKAKDYWLARARAIFLRTVDATQELTHRERRIFFYYGILSILYIILIVGYVFGLLGTYLVERWGGTGFLIFAAGILFLFRYSIVSAGKGIVTFVRKRADFLKRRRTISVILILLVLFTLISIFGRMELRVRGELVLGPIHSQLLKYDSRGYVQLIRYDASQSEPGKQREVSVFSGEYSTTSLITQVGVGDRVEKGQIIARLINSETSRYIADNQAAMNKASEELSLLKKGARPEEIAKARHNLQGNEAEMRLAVQNLKRKNEMYEKKVIAREVWEDAYTDSIVRGERVKAAENELDLLLAGARPEEIRAKEAEIEQLQGQLDFHRQQQDFSEIKSAVTGIVLTLDTGEIVCEIANLDTLEVRIVLSEKELADIKPAQKVKFMVRGYPEMIFYGTVYRLGKKIVTDLKGKRVFYVHCWVANNEHVLKPGMTGVASIYCGKRKLSHLIYRKFFRTIRTEFWDWFDWM